MSHMLIDSNHIERNLTDVIVRDLKDLLTGMHLLAIACVRQLADQHPLQEMIEQIRSACGEAGILTESLSSSGNSATMEHCEFLSLSMVNS